MEGGLKISRYIMGQPEVIPDIRLQSARGDVQGVRETVRFDDILHAFNEASGLFQVGDRFLELASSDLPVTAVTVHPGVIRMFLDPRAEDFDRLLIFPQIGRSPAEPDDGVGIGGIGVEI